MVTLGIETSCDETAVGLLEDGRRILGHSLVSSVAFHQRYGGVVPEIACRHHVELITHCLDEALRQAGLRLSDVGLVAVTYGPGLAGALLVGIAAAKSVSLGLSVPFVGVNHLQAHLYAAMLGASRWPVRAVGLVISGGHTALVRLEGLSGYRLMGQTRDDAVGEAFDKVAKLLELGYPGGPAIERTAAAGNPRRVTFSTPKLRGGSPWDFSFSGIKTAARRVIEGAGPTLDERFVADLAASFQHRVIEDVVTKAVAACRAVRAKTLIVGGGVVANGVLRARLMEAAKAARLRLYLPPVALSTDNAVMVAGLGYQLHRVCGVTAPWTLTAEPNLGMR